MTVLGGCQKEDEVKEGFPQIRGKQYTGTKVQGNTRNISLFRSVVTKQHVFDDKHVHVAHNTVRCITPPHEYIVEEKTEKFGLNGATGYRTPPFSITQQK